MAEGEPFLKHETHRGQVLYLALEDSLGVMFRSRRSHGCRIIELNYDSSGDSKNGALLLVEILDPTGTQNSASPFTALIGAGDGKILGDGNSLAG